MDSNDVLSFFLNFITIAHQDKEYAVEVITKQGLNAIQVWQLL